MQHLAGMERDSGERSGKEEEVLRDVVDCKSALEGRVLKHQRHGEWFHAISRHEFHFDMQNLACPLRDGPLRGTESEAGPFRLGW